MKLQDTVFALKFSPKYAGDAPAPEILGGSFDSATLEQRESDSTYDGVHASTEGSIDVIELTIPKSLRTLREKGARFNPSEGWDIGCWFNGVPHRADAPEGFSWNSAEREFLQATAFANGWKFDGDWSK